MFDECLLDCMQLSFAGCDAFDGFDLAILHLSDGHEATVNDLAVDNHRAGAAFAFSATFFRARQVQLLTQHIQQTLHRIRVKLSLGAVNYAIDLNLARQDCSRAALRKQRISRSQSTLVSGRDLMAAGSSDKIVIVIISLN